MRTSLPYLLVAGLGLALGGGLPAAAATDLERLDALEQEIALLKRKLEVQEEDAVAKASRTPIMGAGPDGFFIKSPDNAFQLRLRGLIQADARWPTQPDDNGTTNFTLRRVRPIFEGTVAEYIDFRIMPDFAGSSTTLFDAYANLRYFPQAQLQVGKFKPPVGLERLQSASATMFIERGFPTFLVPNRDIGGMLQGEFAEGLFAYQIGGFDDASDQQNLVSDTDDGKSVDARLFFHPFRLADVELLDGFGIGVAGTWGDSDGGSMPSYKMQADNTNFFTYLGASGGLPAVLSDGNNYRVSPQGYWYAGPFGLLWEYVNEKTEIHRGASHARPRNEAWQVEASWALTGENAAYKGLVPATSFSPSKGTWGAFEVAARFGEIDFDDDLFPTYANPDVSASKAYGYTLGVNWYLNRWLKFMVNWEQTYFDGGAAGGADRDTEDTVYTRLQLQY